MSLNTYTASAGNCSVLSFYPYVVRAISEVMKLDILYVYSQWQDMDIRTREWYMSHSRIARKMGELAEQDAQMSVAGHGGSY